jgi:hypothetical protein
MVRAMRPHPERGRAADVVRRERLGRLLMQPLRAEQLFERQLLTEMGEMGEASVADMEDTWQTRAAPRH